VTPLVPADDVDVVAMMIASWSRMSCRQLLESVTCYDVMPRKTYIVVVDSELPVFARSCSFWTSLLLARHHGAIGRVWICPMLPGQTD